MSVLLHCFNNYYHAPGNNYCIRAGVEAQILVENNFFRDVKAPYAPWPGTDGKINASGNEFENITGTIVSGDDTIFEPPYGYALDSAPNVPGYHHQLGWRGENRLLSNSPPARAGEPRANQTTNQHNQWN